MGIIGYVDLVCFICMSYKSKKTRKPCLRRGTLKCIAIAWYRLCGNMHEPPDWEEKKTKTKLLVSDERHEMSPAMLLER